MSGAAVSFTLMTIDGGRHVQAAVSGKVPPSVPADDYYTDLARGGFASCAVPVEVPSHSAHFGTIRLDEKSKGFTFMHILQRSVHAFGMNAACEI